MKTEIIAVVDQSGSMFALTNDANGSYQNFLNEQRDVPGEARMTLVKFASNGLVVPEYQAVDIKRAPGLDLVASGNTALYDAIGHTVTHQQQRIAEEGWADLVIVMILTDGFENASREYGPATIKRITAEREAAGWKFIYLMSNQDAFKTAQSLGSSGVYTRSHSADAKGTHESYSYASAQTRNLREQKE